MSARYKINLLSVLVSWGHHSKRPQTGWLKQQNFFVSQFWRPEVWNQDFGREFPPEGCEGESISCLSPSSLRRGYLFWLPQVFIGLWMVFSLCIHIIFPLYGNGNPLQYSSMENPMDRGAWQATVHGVAKSQTWLSSTKAQPDWHLDYAVIERKWESVSILLHFSVKWITEVK